LPRSALDPDRSQFGGHTAETGRIPTAEAPPTLLDLIRDLDQVQP
jgi:hypothetical protein